MHLYETSRLKQYKDHWILDLRFADKTTLSGLELIFYHLVERSGIGLACTLQTEQMNKVSRKDRILKAPPYKINGATYISYGFSCGHIGYFMDEYPEYEIHDPHPYDDQDTCMDDVDTLHLSQAFTRPPQYIQNHYRGDYIYHWRDMSYWVGEQGTDIYLAVFTRRSQTPRSLSMVQGRLL